MFILNLIVGAVLFGLTAFIVVLFNQSRKHAKYFRDRKVPYIGAGGMRLFKLLTGKISFIEMELEVYKEAMKTGAPFVGYSDNFIAPAYYITDLDLTRHIYVKDFEHFANRRTIKTNNPEELLQKMLLSLENDEWKGMRGKLSPTFTTGKIRRMFSIFERSGQRMCQYLEKIVGPSGFDHDICEVYSKYTMDVIASCAFGVNSKSFDCPPGTKSEFESMAQEFQFRFKPVFFLKLILILVAPKVGSALGLSAFDPVPQNYFRKVIKGVIQHRREKGERQDDFLQLMMDTQDGLLKDEENSKESLEVLTGSAEGEAKASLLTGDGATTKLKLDDEAIVANCVLFIIGGFDTLQSLLIFTTFVLAVEQEVQEKLFREVQESLEKNNGKLTYETITQMNYLDLVINGKTFFERFEEHKNWRIGGFSTCTTLILQKHCVTCLLLLEWNDSAQKIIKFLERTL